MPSVAIDTTASILAANFIPAPASGLIRITGFALATAGANEVRLKDEDGNVLTGLAAGTGGGSVSETYERDGQIDLPLRKGVQLTVSTTARVLGHVTYCNPGKTNA